MSISITDLVGDISRVTIIIDNNRFVFYIYTEKLHFAQTIHSILMLIPDCRPGNYINEVITICDQEPCVIRFLTTYDDNFIVLIRGDDQQTMNEYRLARMFGKLFVGYQCGNDQLQVYVADIDNITLYARSGQFSDLERFFAITSRVATLLMSLHHRITDYPEDLNISQYILVDSNSVSIPFEVTHDGRILYGDNVSTIEEFIGRFE